MSLRGEERNCRRIFRFAKTYPEAIGALRSCDAAQAIVLLSSNTADCMTEGRTPRPRIISDLEPRGAEFVPNIAAANYQLLEVRKRKMRLTKARTELGSAWKVLDPTCGSGSFLTHLFPYIANLQLGEQQQIKPLEKELRIRRARRRAVRRMAAVARRTAAASMSEPRLQRPKHKTIDLYGEELEQHILELLVDQDGLCKITGFPLQYDGASSDREMLCSLDRIDSDEGYRRGNLQIVCNFINRWKSNEGDANFRRLIARLRSKHTALDSSDATLETGPARTHHRL